MDTNDDGNEKTRWDRLADALKASFEAMGPFRRLRHQLVKEYVGPSYSNIRDHKYLNKFSEAIDAYVTLLVGGDPMVHVEALPRELDPSAFVWEHALNRTAIEIQLRRKIERWVMDGCILMGIMRAHMADSGRMEDVGGVYLDPGMTTVSNISFDDFVIDMGARSVETARYVGDKYRIPWSQFQEEVAAGTYDEAVAKKVIPARDRGGDVDRLTDQLSGLDTRADDLEQMVEMCDVWLNDNTVVTFWLEKPSTFSIYPQPLGSFEWVDTECSPYLTLGFRDVPDAILPSSPAVHLFEIDQLVSNIAKLVAKQARRQKTVFTHPPGQAKVGETARRIPDGGIMAANKDDVGVFTVPGADAGSMAFLLNLLGFFDTSAGNLTALMGLGAQTGTVGQESLIHDAGNRKIARMSERVMEGVSRVFRSIAVLMWNDEFRSMSMRFPIPGASGYSANLRWSANERAGNFWDYNFRCVSSSLRHEPASTEIQVLKQLLAEVYAPFMQPLMAQGGQIDMLALTDRFARLLNKPWLNDLIVFDGQANQTPEASVDVRKAATSERHYVRHNVSESKPDPLQQQAMQMMRGAGSSSPMTSPQAA
jgi:hypothetical protein